MSNDRVVIKPILAHNPFLKAPDEVARLFGMQISARCKLKQLARILKKDIQLSARSLDNLSGKGISKRSAEAKIYPIFEEMQDYLGFDDTELTSDKIKVFDIQSIWSEYIKVFLATDRISGQAAHLYQPLIAFIERRCDEYRPQKEWFERNWGMSKKEAASHLSEFYRPVLDKTLLSSTQRDRVIHVFDQIYPGAEFEIDDAEIEALAYFLHDFNLSFFAALELSLRNVAQWHGAKNERNRSFLTQVMASEGKCYFGRFIGLIKELSGLTYKDLAGFIPVEFDENDSGRTRQEAQLERLKEWRKGKTKPSWTVMDEFSSNFDVSDQLPLMLFGFICQAIDRIMEGKELSDKDRVVLQRVYSEENYSRYYEKEKAAALTAAESVTSV